MSWLNGKRIIIAQVNIICPGVQLRIPNPMEWNVLQASLLWRSN
jgi:hypothetical protein